MKRSKVQRHFDRIAPKYDFYTKKRDLHYSALKKLLKRFIPRDKNVLEVGCGTGDLLVSLWPKFGYGFDVSSGMIKIARLKYGSQKNLSFSTKWPWGKFDYIFMSDVIEHLENPNETFRKIADLMGPKAKFINTMMNPVWIPVEAVYNFMGWKMPEGPHRRIGSKDINAILKNSGMKVVKHGHTLLMPIKIPVITNFLNKYIEKYLRHFSFIEYFVAVKS